MRTVLTLLAVTLLLACSGRKDAQQKAASGAKESTSSDGGTLTLKGSDTMVILAQNWAEAFMKANPSAVVQVSGGGSGTGIAALINGTTDLANASRAMKDSEKAKVKATRGADAVETRVALDALAVYVHASNPIDSLTIPQLRQLFRGEIKSWKDVGGADRPVLLYSRENNSGTYAYFKEHVLGDLDFAPQAQTLPGTSAVINAVSKDEGGIGYGGIAYAEGVRSVKVAADGGEPVEPSMENATSGVYPLSRFLYVYSIGEPTGVAAAYLGYVLSEPGQAIVEGVGYYPLPKTATGAGAAPTGSGAEGG